MPVMSQIRSTSVFGTWSRLNSSYAAQTALVKLIQFQGRIQGGGSGAKPRTERRRRECRRGVWGPPPENFEKLDEISCNLAYIFAIRMASDIIQNWAFAEQKTVTATISIHTHTHTHTSRNSSDFGHYKIQIQFQKYFLDIVYNVKK